MVCIFLVWADGRNGRLISCFSLTRRNLEGITGYTRPICPTCPRLEVRPPATFVCRDSFVVCIRVPSACLTKTFVKVAGARSALPSQRRTRTKLMSERLRFHGRHRHRQSNARSDRIRLGIQNWLARLNQATEAHLPGTS